MTEKLVRELQEKLLEAANVFEVAEQQRAKAVYELSVLRAQLPCTEDCLAAGYPDETCPAHGRGVAEVWEMFGGANSKLHKIRELIEAPKSGGERLVPASQIREILDAHD